MTDIHWVICKHRMLFSADPLKHIWNIIPILLPFEQNKPSVSDTLCDRSALFSSNTTIYWCRILRMINVILFTAQTSLQLAKCSSTFCFIQQRVVIHRLDKRWIMQMQWVYFIVFYVIRRKHTRLWKCPRPPPSPHASFPFGVIDRCCSLFIWSGFNNMKPIARSGACCCLYGPLSVSCPLIDERERERRRMNQRCVIYYEKRLNGNRATSEINTEQRACRMEWEYQTRCFSSHLFLSLVSLFSPPTPIFKAFKLALVLKKPSNMKVTLLAAGYMPCHFSPTPQKQQGDPVNSLAEQIMWKCWQQQIWAEWVI